MDKLWSKVQAKLSLGLLLSDWQHMVQIEAPSLRSIYLYQCALCRTFVHKVHKNDLLHKE